METGEVVYYYKSTNTYKIPGHKEMTQDEVEALIDIYKYVNSERYNEFLSEHCEVKVGVN